MPVPSEDQSQQQVQLRTSQTQKELKKSIDIVKEGRFRYVRPRNGTGDIVKMLTLCDPSERLNLMLVR